MTRIIKSEQTKWVDGQWVVDTPKVLVGGSAAVGGSIVVDGQEVLLDPAQVLAEAEARAAAILAQAEAEAQDLIERVTRASYEDGLSQGREEAMEQVMGVWRPLLEAFHAEAMDFQAERTARLEELEPDVVRLALMVAAKILRREVRDAHLVRELIQNALTKVDGEQVVRVRLNPDDVNRMVNPLIAPPKFEVMGDPSIGTGGVVIETSRGRVDATFATQFEELARAILAEDPTMDPTMTGVLGALRAPLPPRKPHRESGGFGR